MKRIRGFTLIEAVLAMAVLSAGLVGVMYAFHSMGTSSTLADQTVIASNIARGAIEKVVANRDAGTYAATLTAITGGSFNQNPVPNYAPYTLAVTAYEVDPDKDVGATDDFLDSSPGSGFARVTSTVTWNGGQKTLSLVTVIADH